MKVMRWLDREKIREMCIRYNHYTRGDCRAYDKMLAMARNADADNLELVKKIAIDIYDHSNMNSDGMFNKVDLIEGIMYGLLTECTYTFVDLQDEVIE